MRCGVSVEISTQLGYALALHDRHAETGQLHTRVGTSKDDGQMIVKIPARSGEYALCVRYHCVGIGADTLRYELRVGYVRTRTGNGAACIDKDRDRVFRAGGDSR